MTAGLGVAGWLLFALPACSSRRPPAEGGGQDAEQPSAAVAPAVVDGAKFDDRDGDGKWESGEPGLAGWTIYLDDNRNGQLDPAERSTTTDADGKYAFADVVPGARRIAEVRQAGWVQTKPQDGDHDIFLRPGGEGRGLTFGNRRSSTP